jgi:PRTRC genetic system protein E
MMIETLAKLAHDCGAERISIEIPPSDGATVRVMVLTRFGQNGRVANDEKQGPVLAALAQPLVVSGHPGEIDEKLIRLVDELESGMVAAAKTLPETDAAKQKKALAEAAAKAEKPAEAKVKATPKPGNKTPKATEPEPATTEAADPADAFADDNADSL